MKVFSNTTPFIALSSIGRLDLLPAIFGQIHVVDEVIDECAAGGMIAVAPLRELHWIVPEQSPPQPAPHVLLELDRGEKATLQAALAFRADLVLMDEKIGRNMAEYLAARSVCCFRAARPDCSLPFTRRQARCVRRAFSTTRD